jgi:hypothetical protein
MCLSAIAEAAESLAAELLEEALSVALDIALEARVAPAARLERGADLWTWC